MTQPSFELGPECEITQGIVAARVTGQDVTQVCKELALCYPFALGSERPEGLDSEYSKQKIRAVEEVGLFEVTHEIYLAFPGTINLLAVGVPGIWALYDKSSADNLPEDPLNARAVRALERSYPSAMFTTVGGLAHVNSPVIVG